MGGSVGLIGINEKCLPNLNSVKNHVRFESQNIRLLFLRIHRPQNVLLNFFQPRDGINGISKKPLCQLRIFPQKLQFSISHRFLKRKKIQTLVFLFIQRKETLTRIKIFKVR